MTFSCARGLSSRFRALGVQLLKGSGTVYTIGTHDGFTETNSSRPLGLLAGAKAQVTDGAPAFSLGKAVLMPISTAPLARKETADALITFSNGMVHSVALDGSHPVRGARRQCVEFNAYAMAGASIQRRARQTQRTETSPPGCGSSRSCLMSGW